MKILTSMLSPTSTDRLCRGSPRVIVTRRGASVAIACNLPALVAATLALLVLASALAWYSVRPVLSRQSDVALEMIPPKISISKPKLHSAVTQYVIGVNRTLSEKMAHRIVAQVFLSAFEAQLDPYLVLAIIRVESGFISSASSPYGALGLMQIVPRHHPERFQSISDLYDPFFNISTGVQILSDYTTEAKGSVSAALRRYSGEQNMSGGYEAKVSAERERLISAVQHTLLAQHGE